MIRGQKKGYTAELYFQEEAMEKIKEFLKHLAKGLQGNCRLTAVMIVDQMYKH